jgi:outer membrane lipoprotein SlyB
MSDPVAIAIGAALVGGMVGLLLGAAIGFAMGYDWATAMVARDGDVESVSAKGKDPS